MHSHKTLPHGRKTETGQLLATGKAKSLQPPGKDATYE